MLVNEVQTGTGHRAELAMTTSLNIRKGMARSMAMVVYNPITPKIRRASGLSDVRVASQEQVLCVYNFLMI